MLRSVCMCVCVCMCVTIIRPALHVRACVCARDVYFIVNKKLMSINTLRF